MFAGVEFEKGEKLLSTGDVVVPIVDKMIHQPGDHLFLWDEYTWDGRGMFMDNEGVDKKLSAASPGFGSGVNCYMDLVNVKETIPLNTNTGLHRYSDPGVGAFSTYWNRETLATTSILPGHELFASYGNAWFTSREDDIGPVPLKGDLALAERLLKKYKLRAKRLKLMEVKEEIIEDIWESFAWQNPWNKTSRILFGLPRNWEDTRLVSNRTLLWLRRREHSVTLDWLEEHGICGDFITVKNSTIRQAGRGAFARKGFKTGDVVAPLPFVHLPYRRYLDMFDIIKNEEGEFEASNEKRHTQLLLNYCMGHNESTMLLCPYGTLSSHINHNQTLANVEMVWADPKTSIHNPRWLNKSLSELYSISYSGLSMNLRATRDINSGDEIFIDYGDEWERAWQKHVSNWKPVENSKDYKSAEQLNMETKHLKTEFETLFDPYPNNVVIHLNLAFNNPRSTWLDHWEDGTLQDYIIRVDEYTKQCEILSREKDDEGKVWYTAIINATDDRTGKNEPKKLEKLPRLAFVFFDKPHTTDMHLPGAFRHDIRIPDHLFPDTWRNKR